MITDITFFLVVFSLNVFFYFLLNKKPKHPKALNLPPGPPKLPLIGNLHQIAGAVPYIAFHDLAKKYGPIMHMQFGQNSTIIVSSPLLAKEVLKTNDLALASRPSTLVGDIVFYKNADLVLAPYSDHWRQFKKIMTVELLTAKKVKSFSGVRKQEIGHLVEFVRSSCGKPVIIREKVTDVVSNIICRATFGNSCKQQDVLIEVLDDLGRLTSGFHVIDLFPEFGFLSVITGMKSTFTKIHKILDKIFDDILVERRTQRMKSGSSDNDILDVLLDIKENGGLQFPVTDNNIKALFVNMFAGGTNTSVVAIEWAMTELIRNPSVMKKAQTEVREKFKGREIITDIELLDLKYLKFVIKETLRLHPPAPLLLPRECREDCQIGGYDVPKTTRLFVNAFACATDPEYWHDPESFKPERFEDTSIDFWGTNYEFVPFGGGRRICPGITFSLASIEVALAQLLHHFNWKLPIGLNPKNIDMKVEVGITLVKEVPLALIPTPYSSI